MIDEPQRSSPEPLESKEPVDRRGFIKGVALGAAGATLLAQNAGAQTPAATKDFGPDLPPQIVADLERRSKLHEELPKPAGLRPKAQLDARFPVYFEDAVSQAIPLMTQYFAAIVRRDPAGMARSMHFPYATYEKTDPTVYRSAQEFIANPPALFRASVSDESQLRPGSYDILDSLELHTYNPVNVEVALSFTRYRKDGHRIGVCHGIYAVTNNDGKWGLQLSSTMFIPEQFLNINYADAVQAHLRQGEDWMIGWTNHDEVVLSNRQSGIPGQRTANITAPPGTDQWIRAARAGTPMEPYNTKGVKSRLAVSEPRPPRDTGTRSPAERGGSYPETFKYFFELAAGGMGKYAYTLNLPEARVLHATVDKAHTLGGYIRYTPDSHEITETRSLGIMIYDARRAIWVNSGGFGQMMRRDCTNDDRA